MAIKAQGQHYFQNDDCRINISRVIRKQNLTHEHDLTETEHYHDFIEVVFIVNGQGIQVLEGNEYNVSAGDVFVLQGNQKHFFKNADDIEIINLMFDNKHHSAHISNMIKKLDGYNALFILEPRYRTTHHFKNKLRLSREELAPIELILNTMILEQKKMDVGFGIILKNRLEELLILLSRHYASIKTTQAKSLVRIAKVVDYLENNFEHQIYIKKLAEISCMSTRNFMRTFKGAVGLTPINYLKQVRLQNARKQLRETSHNVTEIAAQCGFTDSNYFIKSFKHAYGVTPNKFRKQW